MDGPMTRDYYEVLGVKSGATEAEIRNAYKRLARKYHPDLNPGSKSAEETFKELSAAYQVLSDPEKRRQYDALRMMGGASRGFGPVPGSQAGWSTGSAGGGFNYRTVDFGSEGLEDFGGIFADLFGRGGNAAQGPRRGADLEFEATIEFEEAVRGTQIAVPLARNATCPVCGGSGRAPAGGRDRNAVCRKCEGKGTVRVSETIKVRVPAGADEGSRVRVAGSGEGGRLGGPPGDLYIILRVKPHRWFRREAGDVVLDLPLSYAEAALGARVEVPTLEGRASLTIPPGTKSGQRFRLKGKGAPLRDGHGRGDLIAVATIVPPRKLDAKARQLLEELGKLGVEDPRGDLDW
jgi:molecular chaperone DnaJ